MSRGPIETGGVDMRLHTRTVFSGRRPVLQAMRTQQRRKRERGGKEKQERGGSKKQEAGGEERGGGREGEGKGRRRRRRRRKKEEEKGMSQWERSVPPRSSSTSSSMSIHFFSSHAITPALCYHGNLSPPQSCYLTFLLGSSFLASPKLPSPCSRL